MTLQAFIEGTDQIVNSGDTITDFRGDKAIFVKASRPRQPGRTGKVVVRWLAMKGVKAGDHSYYDDGRKTTYEYYDTVFDLEVKEIEPQCDSNNLISSAEPFMRLT